jgi:hypothetical protein
VLRMSPKRLNNTSLGMSYHGLSNPSKIPGIVADSLAGVHNVLVKGTPIVKRMGTHKGFCLTQDIGGLAELPWPSSSIIIQ